jgi:hypothetical protein
MMATPPDIWNAIALAKSVIRFEKSACKCVAGYCCISIRRVGDAVPPHIVPGAKAPATKRTSLDDVETFNPWLDVTSGCSSKNNFLTLFEGFFLVRI